jgi:hypothetical protein
MIAADLRSDGPAADVNRPSRRHAYLETVSARRFEMSCNPPPRGVFVTQWGPRVVRRLAVVRRVG